MGTDTRLSLRERLTGVKTQTPTAASGPPSVVMDTPVSALYTPRNNRNFAQYGYMGNGVVYRAVSLLAQTAASIPIDVYKTSGKRTKIENHPLVQLLKKPNSEQAHGAYFEALISHWIISGTTYLFGSFPTQDTPEKQSKPLGLYMLRPDLVELHMSTEGELLNYTYQIKNKIINYPVWKVHPLTFFHPLDDFYGLSPILVAAAIVDRQNEGEKYNIALIQHAARPAGAFIAQGNLSEPAKEALKASIKRRRGFRGAGEELLLEGGLQYVQMGLGPQQLSWLDGDANAGRKIAMIIGVDPLLLNDKQFSTYNNVKEARLAMIDLSVLPMLGRMVDELNNWLVPRFGSDIELALDMDYVDALRDDKAASSTLAVAGWNAGLLTFNEARRKHGEEEIPVDGDFVKLGPAVFVRLPELKDFLSQQKERREAPPVAPNTNLPQLNAPKPKVTVTEVEGNTPAKSIDTMIEHWEHKVTQDEKHRDILATIEAQRQPYIEQMQEHMQQFFETQKQLAIYTYTNHLPEKRTAAIKAALENTQTVLTELLMHYYSMVAGSFAHNVGQQFKMHVSIWRKDVAQDMGTYIAQAVESINQTTTKYVATLFEQKAEPSVEELAEVFENMETWRAESIGLQTVVAAANMGSYYAALQTGLPLWHTWIATQDERTRDDHMQADGQKQFLEAAYEVGDQHFLLFPGDMSFDAPLNEVMNCRCTEAYSVMEHPEENPYYVQRMNKEHKHVRVGAYD